MGKLTLFTLLKIFIGLKIGSLLRAQTDSLSMQFCMYCLHIITDILPALKL